MKIKHCTILVLLEICLYDVVGRLLIWKKCKQHGEEARNNGRTITTAKRISALRCFQTHSFAVILDIHVLHNVECLNF